MPNPKTSSRRLGAVQGMNYNQDMIQRTPWVEQGGTAEGLPFVPNPEQISTSTTNSHLVSLMLILEGARRQNRHKRRGAKQSIWGPRDDCKTYQYYQQKVLDSKSLCYRIFIFGYRGFCIILLAIFHSLLCTRMLQKRRQTSVANKKCPRGPPRIDISALIFFFPIYLQREN